MSYQPSLIVTSHGISKVMTWLFIRSRSTRSIRSLMKSPDAHLILKSLPLHSNGPVRVLRGAGGLLVEGAQSNHHAAVLCSDSCHIRSAAPSGFHDYRSSHTRLVSNDNHRLRFIKTPSPPAVATTKVKISLEQLQHCLICLITPSAIATSTRRSTQCTV